MPTKRRKPKALRLRKVDQDPREDFASPWGWENESWRVRQLASQLDQMAAKARALADRYEVRYRGPSRSSDEY
jgi:hypothetical protein